MKPQPQILSKDRRNRRPQGMISEPLPIELVMKILSRVPAKSIGRSRCVSKLWNSILGLPYFRELYLTRSSARPQLLFAYSENRDFVFLSTPQLQNPDENSSPVTVNHLSQLPFPSPSQISGSVRGLLCLTYKPFSKETMQIICNPSTGQTLLLPELKTMRAGVLNFYKVNSLLGYDPIEKQVKILSVTRSIHSRDGVVHEHQVLTLGTRELSWRMVECCIPHYTLHKEICINGVLYYPAYSTSTQSSMIVCFDVRLEKFSFIHVETTFIKAVFRGMLINYKGKLGSLTSHGSRRVNGTSRSLKLLVIGDYEKQEWSKHKLMLPPSWKNVVGEASLSFVGVNGTHEIVLSNPSHVLYYNIREKTIVRIEIQGMEAFRSKALSTFLDHVEVITTLDCNKTGLALMFSS